MLRTSIIALATAFAMPAAAQVFGPTYGTDYGYDTFNEGFMETGYYDSLDMDDDSMLNRREFATGLYADYDTDADGMLTADEFETGYGRYFGADAYDSSMFDTYDADASGMIDTTEFSPYYTETYGDAWAEWDANADDMLDYDEYSTGLYNTADLDQNQVLTVEEEGWFEGWFDGDDIEVELQSLNEAFTDI